MGIESVKGCLYMQNIYDQVKVYGLVYDDHVEAKKLINHLFEGGVFNIQTKKSDGSRGSLQVKFNEPDYYKRFKEHCMPEINRTRGGHLRFLEFSQDDTSELETRLKAKCIRMINRRQKRAMKEAGNQLENLSLDSMEEG